MALSVRVGTLASTTAGPLTTTEYNPPLFYVFNPGHRRMPWSLAVHMLLISFCDRLRASTRQAIRSWMSDQSDTHAGAAPLTDAAAIIFRASPLPNGRAKALPCDQSTYSINHVLVERRFGWVSVKRGQRQFLYSAIHCNPTQRIFQKCSKPHRA